jgi:hypothetical protein
MKEIGYFSVIRNPVSSSQAFQNRNIPFIRVGRHGNSAWLYQKINN